MPASFELLLEALKRDSANDALILDPTQQAICILVTRCIQYRGPSLVKELVEGNGTCPSTVEVLANILSEADQATPNDDNDLLMSAGCTFLDCIGFSRFAQRKLISSPGLLCTFPIAEVVPRLVALCDSNIDNNDVVTAVTAAATHLLVSSLPDDVSGLVRVLVESLGRCDDEMLASGDNENTRNGDKQGFKRSTRVCRKITSSWRRTLLQKPACGVHGFASVLSSVADTIFADSSSSIPLTLLGSIVGDELSPMVSNEEQVSRVHFAVIALVRKCSNELGETEYTGRNSVVDCKTQESKSIYSRLSPLLLLRRTPSGYYKVAWRVNANDCEEMELLFSQLADKLSARLDIARPSKLHVAFSSEERQLAAEIAGRCLPFSTPPPCGCYQIICFPAFSSALQTLKVISNEQLTTTATESLRAARAALYACCNHVPLAEDNEDGEGVFGIVSFLLEVLNVDITEAVDNSVDEDDIIQLQTGCIDFIAVCLESTLQRHMKNRGELSPSKAVQEVDNRGDGADVTTKSGWISFKDALSISCRSIASSLRSGAPVPCQLRLRNNIFPPESSRVVNKELSISARTCMWNAFLIVSQRCQYGARLNLWANLTAPWVLDWASLAPVDDSLRHPLCMAAALQVIFVLITRTKAFDCLAGGKAISTSVIKAHRLAISSIKSETKVGGDYARTTMRKAALKLLLALVTIDQIEETNSLHSCLSPGELGEAVTLLNGTANMDADAEVRALAGHILSGMHP